MNFSKSDGEGVLNQSNHILNREYYQLQYLDVTKAVDSNIIFSPLKTLLSVMRYRSNKSTIITLKCIMRHLESVWSKDPLEEGPEVPPLVGGVQQDALDLVLLLHLLLGLAHNLHKVGYRDSSCKCDYWRIKALWKVTWNDRLFEPFILGGSFRVRAKNTNWI